MKLKIGDTVEILNSGGQYVWGYKEMVAKLGLTKQLPYYVDLPGQVGTILALEKHTELQNVTVAGIQLEKGQILMEVNNRFLKLVQLPTIQLYPIS